MADDLDPERFLRRAYMGLRRPGWGSYDVEIVSPERSHLIEQYAQAIERQDRIIQSNKTRRDAGKTPASPAPSASPRTLFTPEIHAVIAPHHAPLPVHLDRQRLASGEREDDE